MVHHQRFDKSASSIITDYESSGAAAVHLGSGSGESHTYVVHFEPGGRIGSHVTGFGQLLIVIEGRGWVSSEGHRRNVQVGDTIFLPRGVEHAKGSESGMTVVMVQSFDLEPGSP